MVTSSDLATFTTRALGTGARRVLVVSADGEVDRAHEDTLRDLVGAATGDVVVDLRRARFVSSGIFCCLLEEGARLGRRVRLVVPSEGVAQRTLRLLGLAGDFDVHTEPRTALGAQNRGARRSRCDASPSSTSGPPNP